MIAVRLPGVPCLIASPAPGAARPAPAPISPTVDSRRCPLARHCSRRCQAGCSTALRPRRVHQGWRWGSPGGNSDHRSKVGRQGNRSHRRSSASVPGAQQLSPQQLPPSGQQVSPQQSLPSEQRVTPRVTAQLAAAAAGESSPAATVIAAAGAGDRSVGQQSQPQHLVTRPAAGDRHSSDLRGRWDCRRNTRCRSSQGSGPRIDCHRTC